MSAPDAFDVTVGFIINNKTLRATFPSCPEARRLHPVGALVCPHPEHAAPVARPPPATTGIFDAIYYIDTR